MMVKENHPNLLKKIASVFSAPSLYEAEFDTATVSNRGHGREEVRTLGCTYDLPRHFTGFAGVRQIFRLERQVTHKKSGRASSEVVYGMTSLPRLLADAGQLLSLVRGHWTIENRVHYVRDVTFGEDASVVRKGNIPHIMAAFRNTAIALLRREGYGNLAAARRYFSANPKRALGIMGCKITE